MPNNERVLTRIRAHGATCKSWSPVFSCHAPTLQCRVVQLLRAAVTCCCYVLQPTVDQTARFFGLGRDGGDVAADRSSNHYR